MCRESETMKLQAVPGNFTRITSHWYRSISNELWQKIAGPSRWTNIFDRFNRGFFRSPCPEKWEGKETTSPSGTFHSRARKFFILINWNYILAISRLDLSSKKCDVYLFLIDAITFNPWVYTCYLITCNVEK